MAKKKKANKKRKNAATNKPKAVRVETTVTDIEPMLDLIARLQERGPLVGESTLAFECKVASIQRGRDLWLQAYTAAERVLTKTCALLGIANSNAYKSMHAFGITRTLLDTALDGDRDLD